MTGATASRVEAVGVVVPARDEAATIGACLDSLDGAVATLQATRPEIEVRTVVVAHRCTDDTARLAAGRAVVLTRADGELGLARAAGVDEVLRLLGRDPALTWLAMTDADSTVPAGWLTVQVALAESGADVVVGTVTPDDTDFTTEQRARWRLTHIPGRPNGHVHGANLGVRASAYRAAGGFGPLEVGEDNDLVARLRRTGAAEVASDAGDVRTSSRRVNRAVGGYADWLQRQYG